MDDKAFSEWRASIERRIGALERDVAVILSNYVTREDLARLEGRFDARFCALEAKVDAKVNALESRLVRWFLATSVSLAGLCFVAGKYL